MTAASSSVLEFDQFLLEANQVIARQLAWLVFDLFELFLYVGMFVTRIIKGFD